MKKSYPSREKNRWEHALSRPLRGIRFEALELMRMDLFEYIDVLTACPYDDKKSNLDRARDLRRIALRLTELTPRRAKALRAARKAGRIDFGWVSESEGPAPIAQEWQRYWAGVKS